jgi:hypothetical protein
MKKLVCALVVTCSVVGIMLADEQRGQLYDVKDGKAKFKKRVTNKKFDDAVDVTFAKDVVVKSGTAKTNKTDKKLEVTEGDAVEGGLMSDTLKNATADKVVNVVIYTADEDKGDVKKGDVTKVIVVKGKKGAN